MSVFRFLSHKKITVLLLILLLLATAAEPSFAGSAANKYTVKVTSSVRKYKKSIQAGSRLQIAVKCGNKKLSVKKVSFSSSGKSVATVSKKGVITAKRPGKAVITVRYKKKKAKITVTVKAKAISVTSGSMYSKTIKNYLFGSLAPVGKALYIWGGGWNDSTRKGVSSTMTKWYKIQDSNYDYHSYNDLTANNRAKGFDCAGYVGWCTYQVMHSVSNEGTGYTVRSGDIGSKYKSLGWGTTNTQAYISSNNYVLKPGDIGYNESHCFIVIGQCKDKSVVILHAIPQAGVQISGTATPEGNHDSEAVSLARKYMARYPSSLAKYEYNTSVGNYILSYNYFRWNRSTLADPDGYMNKYADEILKDLFDNMK